MKNYRFLLTVLCFLTAIPGFSEWVLLDRKQNVSISSIEFLEFVTPEYEDYILVVDMMEPLGGFADVVMQFSSDKGTTWSGSQNGGLLSISTSNSSITHKASDSKGIPLTDVQNAGYFFIGQIHLYNARGITNYGPFAISGMGTGSNNAATLIAGSINSAYAIDSVRFVSTDPEYHPIINRASVTLYGLKEYE